MTTLTDWLTAAKARADAATEGPWRWRNTTGEVYLLGARTRVVMGFERMGMHGAQPSFPRPSDGLIYPAGRENLNAIPNAAFMAHSRTEHPAMADALLVVLAALDRADARPGADGERKVHTVVIRQAIATALGVTP